MIDLGTLESIAVSQGFASLGAYVDHCLAEYGSWDPSGIFQNGNNQEEVMQDENSRDI